MIQFIMLFINFLFERLDHFFFRFDAFINLKKRIRCRIDIIFDSCDCFVVMLNRLFFNGNLTVQLCRLFLIRRSALVDKINRNRDILIALADFLNVVFQSFQFAFRILIMRFCDGQFILLLF
ncbi:hypothetical protein SDC9_152221 [bioreactor metagenome]|uniref:Uncharacterized protein n=1 Tax=bioreactor metagenome TaxID=1076179 RepID=A0A645EUR7_9ZZZZ